MHARHAGRGSSSAQGFWRRDRFSLAEGVDTTELFQGLDDNACQCPHWSYVVHGQITTTGTDGTQETVRENDMFFWPPGHSVRVDQDAEIMMFSPQDEHRHVLDHMKSRAGA